MKITREMFISGPYKDCPNCKSIGTFGVFMAISGSKKYQRECLKCSHEESFPLPKIEKKVIYLDQFILSNLTKLLDKTYPKNSDLLADPFWSKLYEKLEHVSKAQAVVFPDSFFHKDESVVGKVNFQYIRRLYQHLSTGKTFFPNFVIERIQIAKHFEAWIKNKPTEYSFDPAEISFEGNDLHEWSIGLGVSVNPTPKRDEIDELIEQNTKSKQRLIQIWTEWQQVTEFDFISAVKNESLALRFHINNVVNFYKRQAEMIQMLANGENVEWDINSLMPPPSKDLLDELLRICRQNDFSEQDGIKKISEYFQNADTLLEIPKVKIGSVMYANLARSASLGKKEPPKSFADVEFISSYLPYCDAMFIDKESKKLLTELPKNTPNQYRLEEFTTNIYTLNEKEEFLQFLDQIISDIPQDQINILEDMSGKNYFKPYWELIEHERKEDPN